MRRHLKARYLGPAMVALVMVIYGVIASVRSTRENLRDFREVAHTRSVQYTLGEVLSTMQDLETGQRGYVVTGREDFLQPYDAAMKFVDSRIDRLAELTRNHPEQQVRVGALREAARQKREELARVIEVRREQGLAAASLAMTEGSGKRYMDRVREVIAEMEETAGSELDARQEKLITSFKDTNTAVVTSGVVAILAGGTGIVLLALFLLAKERQERLQFEKEKAVAADRAKTDFLAMMSHEIRTPMNAILGFGELLHDLVDTSQEKHFAQAILTSGNSLLSLINDILDLSKIEAAKLELHPETTDMRRFAENLETLFSFRSREKGLDYSIALDPSVPPLLSLDALRLRQVLVNLIGNAVKFTREGHVHVRIHADPGPDETVELHLEIEDSGIGIPADKLRDIFRPFYQVESMHGRHFQGTGLGLSISERLVGLMGGRIEVASEPGKGSTFHVTLPVQRRQERHAQDAPGRNEAIDFNRLAPSKILVVDDVPLNRELIRGYLEHTHHQVIEAENGEEAVILCRRHLPEIVLMDIRMPVVDGRTAHAMLKSQETTRHIPLVAVTASSLLDSQTELKRVFDGFASKPLSRERLYAELAKFLPFDSSPAPVAAAPAEELVPPATPDRADPELVRLLTGLHETRWPGLVKLVPAQGTAQFAATLSQLARDRDCPALASYATQLAAAAATMDFARAGRLLEGFPDLIARLSHATDL